MIINAIENFNALDPIDKKKFYQEANESHEVDLVRQMNNLGMKPSVPPFSGPSIVSNFMDIATKYEIILGYLKSLRKSNRLLTEKEFEPLSTKKWIKKDSLSRLLGCDHLIQKIQENQFKYMKVPLKIAVIQTTQSLNITGWQSHQLYNISSDQITIYAEKIPQVRRKLLREEIDELIELIAKANFLDLWPENIFVAEEGVYFIDTEFKSFDGSIQWEKMTRFESFVSENDKSYFEGKIQERLDAPRKRKEINSFDHLVVTLEDLKEISEQSSEKAQKYQAKMEEIQTKLSKLEYVGAKKAGNHWLAPNKFTFDLKQVLFN